MELKEALRMVSKSIKYYEIELPDHDVIIKSKRKTKVEEVTQCQR